MVRCEVLLDGIQRGVRRRGERVPEDAAREGGESDLRDAVFLGDPEALAVRGPQEAAAALRSPVLEHRPDGVHDGVHGGREPERRGQDGGPRGAPHVRRHERQVGAAVRPQRGARRPVDRPVDPPPAEAPLVRCVDDRSLGRGRGQWRRRLLPARGMAGGGLVYSIGPPARNVPDLKDDPWRPVTPVSPRTAGTTKPLRKRRVRKAKAERHRHVRER